MERGYLIRPFVKGEEEYVAQAHRRLYTAEQGWGDGFCKYAMEIPRAFAARLRTPREEMWIAEKDGTPVGCIAVMDAGDNVAQLRLFLVEPEHRGTGVGKALFATALDNIRTWGYDRAVLWTADTQKNARIMYGKLGFVMTETASNTTWSATGKTVVEEKWELKL